MDGKNIIRAVLEFVEGVGKAVAAADTVTKHASAVADRVRGVQDKSVGIEVTVKPNGDVLLSCARFRLSFAPDRARALGRKLILVADEAETSAAKSGESKEE